MHVTVALVGNQSVEFENGCGCTVAPGQTRRRQRYYRLATQALHTIHLLLRSKFSFWLFLAPASSLSVFCRSKHADLFYSHLITSSLTSSSLSAATDGHVHPGRPTVRKNPITSSPSFSPTPPPLSSHTVTHEAAAHCLRRTLSKTLLSRSHGPYPQAWITHLPTNPFPHQHRANTTTDNYTQ